MAAGADSCDMLFRCAVLCRKVAALTGQTLPQGIIVVGAFLLILAFVGAFSAWKEIRIGLGLVSAGGRSER